MVTLTAAKRLRADTTDVQRAQAKKEIADLQLKMAKAKESGQDTEPLKRQLETLKQKLENLERR